MSLTDLPPAAAQNNKRRKSRPAQRWTPGHVLPFVLAIFAVIFVLAALRDRSAQTSVVVASRQIPAGATINAGDTRTIKMRTGDADALVRAARPRTGHRRPGSSHRHRARRAHHPHRDAQRTGQRRGAGLHVAAHPS